jgi:hypothetical protein
MNPAQDIRHHRRFGQRVTRFSVLFGAVALFAVPAARADFPFPPNPREVHHEIHAVVHDVLRSLGRIPAQIHRDHVRHLQPFFAGNAYYGPHRHHHATYSFPVWVGGEVSYRPYVYCNGRLHGSYAVRPQFWSGWGVASQGRWCGHHHAYYPSVHACFRPQHHSSYYPSHGAPYPSHHGSHRGSSHGHRGHGSHHHDRSCHHDNGHHRR